jgi:3,4-dihydroxy 2-butanone 4-phosphate synthase / GTP cyclohydrolase II
MNATSGESFSVERVERAIDAIRSGRFVILSDHESRENEGDLILAAQFATPEAINFMATHARGLICLAMDSELIDRLQLPPMVQNNESKLGTAFTVSIGAKTGITTGISAFDRAHTVQTAIRDHVSRDDLVVPGHVFPLRARQGGVLVRAGHTEGSVDLARLAGLKAAGVICEILKADGSMARRDELYEFGLRHEIPILSMEDLIFYRLQKDHSLIQDLGTLRRVEVHGKSFELRIFRSVIEETEHLAWVLGSPAELASQESLVRVHSEDLLSDYYASTVSMGGASPLYRALEKIAQHGVGALLVLRHEQRFSETFRADDDSSGRAMKKFGIGAQILRAIGVRDMCLLSNAPKKMVGLAAFGIAVTRVLPFFENEQVFDEITSKRIQGIDS